MVRVKHVAGPGRFAHAVLSGTSTHGDEHEVPAEAADYLCDDRGYFERTGDITLSEDEYEVTTDEPLEEKTKDDLYEMATGADIDGRSEMDKAELVEALSESED